MTDVAAAIVALEAQRGVLGDAVVDAAIAALRAQQAGAAAGGGPAPRGAPRRDGAARSPDASPRRREPPPDADGGAGPPGDPQPAAQGPSERRLVTILFADIVGSTTLAEHADPEEVAGIVEGAFDVMTRAIDDHGGRVGRLMGDGMIAFFGAPVGHEDDPLRAVRAACAIRDGVGAYGAALAARGGPAVQVRVGLHTGLAHVGRIGGARHGEYTVIGDAANTAARLEANAPHGQVLISEATARLVRGAVPLVAHGALALKGKREPVETHVVDGLPAAAAVPRGLVATGLVGRSDELGALRGLAEEAHGGSGRIVLVEAEAGMGKTRLLAELRAVLAAVRPGARWLEATAEAARAAEPYALLRDLVARGCGVRDGEVGDGARAAIAARLADVFGDDEPAGSGGAEAALDAALAARDMAGLLGLDDAGPGEAHDGAAARAARDRALAALGRWLAAEGRAAGGAVVALDDLHWADAASTAALASLAAACAGAPVLLLLAARPGTGLAEAWGAGAAASGAPADDGRGGGASGGDGPGGGATGGVGSGGDGRPRLERLVLRPLDEAAQAALVEGLERAVEGGLDARTRGWIAARSEGNPYYAEELVRMLRDGSGDPDDLPPTLAGLLQARIDGLPGGPRDALRRAAVVGRVFWDEAVAALHGDGPEPDDPGRDLDVLADRALIAARARSALAGAREYAFAHALLRDAAYGNLLLATRRMLHARAASWLEAVTGDRADGHAGEIAAHHAAAGDGRMAARWFLRAARRAADVFANADALAACDAGLAALDGLEATDAPRAELLALRCAVDDRLGDRAAQREDVAALRAVAERLGPTARARALDAEADLRWATADFAGARRAAEAGLAALASAGAHGHVGPGVDADAALDVGAGANDAVALEGHLLRNVGRAAREAGDYAAARAAFEVAAARFAAAGARRAGADALVQIGALDSELGAFAPARAVLERALDAAAEPEALPERAWALDNLAIVHACLGELDAALRRGEEALVLARRFGGRRRELSNRINLSAIAALLGRYDDARAHAALARDLARAVDDPSGEALACFALAEAARAVGDGEAAVAEAEAGRAAAAGQGRAFLDALGAYALSGALLARDADGDPAAALRAAEQCVAAAEAAGLASYRVVGLARRVEALGKLGRAAEAAESAREASAALAETGAIEEPEQLVHLAVHHALAAVGDGGAHAALRAAGRAVLAQARRIADRGARLAFLEEVAVNRAVVEALEMAARSG